MRNRVKCTICNDIIESVSLNDLATCSCANLMITGGAEDPRIKAKEWNEFCIVEDDGKEVKPLVGDAPKEKIEEAIVLKPLTREEKLKLFEAHIERMTMSYPLVPSDVTEGFTFVLELLRS